MGVVVVVAIILIVLAWFMWPTPGTRRPPDNPELEAAERDVQDAADQDSVRDWGPGTGQKPLP